MGHNYIGHNCIGHSLIAQTTNGGLMVNLAEMMEVQCENIKAERVFLFFVCFFPFDPFLSFPFALA